jgi:hypothetical protein
MVLRRQCDLVGYEGVSSGADVASSCGRYVSIAGVGMWFTTEPTLSRLCCVLDAMRALLAYKRGGVVGLNAMGRVDSAVEDA